MIQADLHLHTCFSHGQNTPFEMHAAAHSRNLRICGFSEHSPRPEGYNYASEYRERLSTHLQDYVQQVNVIKKSAAANPQGCQVLFGMEMDWLKGQEEFIAKSARAFDFDYLLGSVHFLDHWGFDDSPAPWQGLSQEEREKIYIAYFKEWAIMIRSGLFQIAAHPDLIKIFSVESFRLWLQKPSALALIKKGLVELRNAGMAMEISSAGLRKPCGEIYPAPVICKMAAELALPVSPASDAHNYGDVGYAFAELAAYARSFGFDKQAVFNHGKMSLLPF